METNLAICCIPICHNHTHHFNGAADLALRSLVGTFAGFSTIAGPVLPVADPADTVRDGPMKVRGTALVRVAVAGRVARRPRPEAVRGKRHRRRRNPQRVSLRFRPAGGDDRRVDAAEGQDGFSG